MSFKGALIVAILILAAFGAGYGLGYWKLYTAEQEWMAAKGEMQSKISGMEKELALAKAREKLWEIPERLSEATAHLADKNFGLAAKALDGAREDFLAALNSLGEETKNRFDSFLPALEGAKKEVESMGADASKKVEEAKKLFEQALRPAKKG
jgi:hypothetical protein